MGRPPVYLDNHATTPVDRRVLAAMLPYFTEMFGNPSSASHQWGWQAREAVEQARRSVARLVGSTAREIVFTSGATESNNLAIQGVAALAPEGRRHVVVSAIEHKSVLEAAGRLGRAGWRVTIAPVDAEGIVDLSALATAIDDATAIVSVMLANNEIGTIQPVREIAGLAHARGALVHTDAAQAIGKIPVDVDALGVDLLSLTAHKFYGPKGCGAIYVRKHTKLEPLVVGGGQEHGVRSGTLNVPGIVGLGHGSAICLEELSDEARRVARQRDRLLEGLRAGLGGVHVNGSMTSRLPNNLHVRFDAVDGDTLLVGIGDIAVSAGSACDSSAAATSHVLRALGPAPAGAVVRFGLGRFTTDEDVDYAIEKFTKVVAHLRRMAPAH